ncbi:hypothetical protein FEO86_03525 [Stenotrophomonas maltophilia]|nr:hypothetical protein FEO86_03525 [Stenotrophomonas maltophilia]
MTSGPRRWRRRSTATEQPHPRMAWMYCGSRETVEGGAVWVCRTVGAMDGAIEPPWTGLRRVLQTHTAQPFHGMPAFDVDVASAGAGRSPAKSLYRKITVASVP